MEIVLLIIAKTVSFWLSAVSFAMLVRMLLPLIVDPEQSKLYLLSYAVSEPAIIPVRAVMAKLDIAQDSPLDIPFTVTYFLIILIRIFLP